MTIYPFIFWSKKKVGWQKQEVVVHEMYHWDEQKYWKETKCFGLVRWLVTYIYQWCWFNVILGLESKEHPMEKPAYEAQGNVVG